MAVVDVYRVGAENWADVATFSLSVDGAASQEVVETWHYEQLFDFGFHGAFLGGRGGFDSSAFHARDVKLLWVNFRLYPHRCGYQES